MANERERKVPATEISAPADRSKPKDVRDEKQVPRQAGAEDEAAARRGSVDPRETLGE